MKFTDIAGISVECSRGIIIKITLHDATAVMGYFLQPSRADPINNRALHSVFRAA
jgi:hypothetical protein